jgi:hypothetical protein
MIDWKEEVNQVLKRNNILMELSYSDAVQLVIELYYRHGKSYLWLQDEFFTNHVSYFSIRKLLIEEHIPRRGRGGCNREKCLIPEEELRNQTMSSIQRAYGCSMPTIMKRRKEYGIKGKYKPTEALQG